MRKRLIRRTTRAFIAGSLGVGLILGQNVLAQESDGSGGLRLTFGLSSSVRVDDNPELSFGDKNETAFWDNRLSFGVISERGIDTFRLNVNAGLQLLAEEQGGFGTNFDDPRLSFRYDRRGVNSTFGLSADFRQNRLQYLDPLLNPLPGAGGGIGGEAGEPPISEGEVPPDSTDLIQSSGRRLVYSLGATLELGVNDPLGLRIEARRQERDYRNVNDPELFDTSTDTLNATLRYDISPRLRTRLRLSERQYSASDSLQTDRETQDYTLGATLDLNKTLELDASIGGTRILTDETIGGTRQSREQNGTNASVSLVQQMTNGQVALSFIRSYGVNSGRSTIEVSRQLELPRGSLEAALGATRGIEGNTEVTGRLAYTQDLLRGAISASVQRNVTTNILNEDVLTTRASVNYKADLTGISALSLGLDYTRISDGGSGASTERERATFRASYSRDLTDEVAMVAGYQHRLRSEGGDQADSNSVFFTLSRKFDLRP